MLSMLQKYYNIYSKESSSDITTGVINPILSEIEKLQKNIDNVNTEINNLQIEISQFEIQMNELKIKTQSKYQDVATIAVNKLKKITVTFNEKNNILETLKKSLLELKNQLFRKKNQISNARRSSIH